MRISDPRWLPNAWPRRVLGEPGDAAEVDDQRGLVASSLSAREGRACIVGASSQFRRVGEAGQLTIPLVGGARPGLPSPALDPTSTGAAAVQGAYEFTGSARSRQQ
jgi:hypothetical protein